jgi:hypothetical protein
MNFEVVPIHRVLLFLTFNGYTGSKIDRNRDLMGTMGTNPTDREEHLR